MYTLTLTTGIVTRDSDGVQIAPAQSTDDADYAAYIDWINQGNFPTEQFDTPANLLANAKTTQKNAVNDLRNLKLTDIFTDSNNIPWNMGTSDIANLNAVCTLITAGAITGNVTWRDSNNTNHIMTPQQMIQLAGEMAVHGQTMYSVSWYHKANIDALTTVDDVNAYDITAGW